MRQSVCEGGWDGGGGGGKHFSHEFCSPYVVGEQVTLPGAQDQPGKVDGMPFRVKQHIHHAGRISALNTGVASCQMPTNRLPATARIMAECFGAW